jgi:hypothetical protein
MYGLGPVGIQDSEIWVASVLNRWPADSRAEPTHRRAVMTASQLPSAIKQTQGRQPRALGGAVSGRATVKTDDGRCLPESWWTTTRSFEQTTQDSASGIADECGPKSPDSHQVIWGLTSRPPGPRAGFPPVSRLPAGFSPLRLPSSGFPSSGVLPWVSLRPAFSGSFPTAVARAPVPVGFPRGPFHLSSIDGNAAAGLFRQRLVPGGKDQGHHYCRTPSAWIARDLPALQLGGGSARCDAAPQSPLRAATSAGHRRARAAQRISVASHRLGTDRSPAQLRAGRIGATGVPGRSAPPALAQHPDRGRRLLPPLVVPPAEKRSRRRPLALRLRGVGCVP